MNAKDSNVPTIADIKNTPLHVPKTLMEAVVYFSDLAVAHQFFVDVRWADGVVCPRCGSTGASYNAKYRRFQCNHSHERRQFTVKTGTMMEDSPLGLDKWAAGFWLEVNAKNSISSYEIHRALGITQKSAWFMLHRIRLALKSGLTSKMGSTGGSVEADETFVGGLAKNMHKHKRARVITGTGGMNKTAVMGLLERHTEKGKSRVHAKVVKDRKGETLQPIVRENVKEGANVYTDALPAYTGLADAYFHEFVDHAEAYVRGAVHTNGMENFWALFKRCIKGTHVSVEPYHLEAYVDSEAFRFNNRSLKDGGRFVAAINGATGKRITYKELIGDDHSDDYLAT
jgi:transposase-like protein